MNSQKKKTVLTLPVIVGVGVGSVSLIAIIILFTRGGGQEPALIPHADADKDLKTLEAERCDTLLAHFKVAFTDGVEEAELERMYAEGARKCPQHFLPLGGTDDQIETTIQQDSEGLSRTDQGATVDAYSETKGTVVGSQDTKSEKKTIKAGIGFRTRVAKKFNLGENVLKKKEIDSQPTQAQKQVPSTIQNNESLTSVQSQKEPQIIIEPQKTPKSPSQRINESPKSTDSQIETKMPENDNKNLEDPSKKKEDSGKLDLPPAEMKALRLKAAKDINAKIRDAFAKGTCDLSELVKKNECMKEIKIEINELVYKGVFHYLYYFNFYLAVFFKQEMVKNFRNNNVAEAQKWYNMYLKAYHSDYFEFLDSPPKCPKPAQIVKVTELNDYKLWSAIQKGEFKEAQNLVKQEVMLPKFIRFDLGKENNQEKFIIFKELNEDQFSNFWDYMLLNDVRMDALKIYSSFNGNESLMREKADEFNKSEEMMILLWPDIHPLFNFESPKLPEVKTLMQEIGEYLKDKPKSPQFEAVWKALESNPKRNAKAILNVVVCVTNLQDQIEILNKFKVMKSHLERGIDEKLHKVERQLLEILQAYVKKNLKELNEAARKVLYEANSQSNFEPVQKFLDELIAIGGDSNAVLVAALKFWQAVIPYYVEEKAKNFFISSYHEFYSLDSCNIDNAADKNNAALIQFSAECIQALAASPTATDINRAHAEYAKAFAQMVSKVGAEKISLLWNRYECSKRVQFIDSLPLDLLVPVVRSKENLAKLKNDIYRDPDSKTIIEVTNKNQIKELKERERKFVLVYYTSLDRLVNYLDDEKELEPKFTSFALNLLLEYLKTHFYTEWTPLIPSANVSMADLMPLFNAWKASKAPGDKEKFFAAAKLFVMKLQNEQMASLPKKI